MSQDWNISLRGHQCASSGDEFDDGVLIHSRLLFTEEGYVREDYLSEHWNESFREGALSVWKAAYEKPKARPPEPLRKENAESLLRELIETDDEANRNVIFILAVMLERKRMFVERDVSQREDGLKMRVYEHKVTGEMFAIPDPGLKMAEIERVQEDVLVRLGGEVPGQKQQASEPETAAGADAEASTEEPSQA